MGKQGRCIRARLGDKAWLYQKYVMESLSARNIAKKICCNKSSVLRALKRQSIQKRKSTMAYTDESMFLELNDKSWLNKKYHVENMSARKIAKEIGCTKPTVLAALKRNNIRIRGLSEARKYVCPSIETLHKRSVAMTKMWATKGTLTTPQRKINVAMRGGIWHALDGTKNGRHWEDMVGYTLAELMGTLEREFRDGMSWGNYGAVWHIDHIIPLAHFHYDSSEDPEFEKAWALNNLQPLLVTENLKKHTKFRFY